MILYEELSQFFVHTTVLSFHFVYAGVCVSTKVGTRGSSPESGPQEEGRGWAGPEKSAAFVILLVFERI